MQALKATIRSMGRLKGTEAVTERQYGVFTEMMNDITTLMSNNVYQYSAVSETELESPENGPSKHDPFTMVIRIGNNDKSAFGKDKRAVEEIFDDLQRMMDDGRDGLRVEAVMFIARPLAKKNMTCSNEKDVRSL